MRPMKKLALGSMLVFAGWLALACGRSEDVGWSDRERPDEDAAGQTETAPGTAEGLPGQPEPGSPEALMQEYQSLTQSLGDVRDRAMQDPAMQQQWEELSGAVEDRMVEKNPELDQLMTQADEIQDRVADVESAGDTLDTEERADLARQWQMIQSSIGQARTEVLQEPEYRQRLESFQSDLYDRMRALEPGRSDEIDRLESVGQRLVQVLDSISRAQSSSNQ